MKITEAQFGIADRKRLVWLAEPAAGVAIEDMLKPLYWTHVASKLTKGTRIEAVAEDGTWFAEFFVKSANRIEAHVKLMRKVELSKPVTKLKVEPKYKVEHVGGGRWRVLRTEDKAELETGFKGKELAEKWLVNYLKEIAA